MSYTYLASDVTIEKILTEINQNNDKKKQINKRRRPDIFLLYDIPETDLSTKNAILIEFKKGNIDNQEKTSATGQVAQYKRALEKNIKIGTFYCYIICDLKDDDEDLDYIMGDNYFTKVMSNTGCLYYKYLPDTKAHVTFISIKSIFTDA